MPNVFRMWLLQFFWYVVQARVFPVWELWWEYVDGYDYFSNLFIILMEIMKWKHNKKWNDWKFKSYLFCTFYKTNLVLVLIELGVAIFHEVYFCTLGFWVWIVVYIHSMDSKILPTLWKSHKFDIVFVLKNIVPHQ